MLVYLDTNIWIYAYENDPVFGATARQFLQTLRRVGPHLGAPSSRRLHRR
jgi:predicted nucleic acid-binding protein